jgi:hypothetical protein
VLAIVKIPDPRKTTSTPDAYVVGPFEGLEFFMAMARITKKALSTEYFYWLSLIKTFQGARARERCTAINLQHSQQ